MYVFLIETVLLKEDCSVNPVPFPIFMIRVTKVYTYVGLNKFKTWVTC